MVVSLQERLQILWRRQRLQRRIDLLVSNPPYGGMDRDSSKTDWIDPFLRSKEPQDDPLVNSDVEAAIAEAFRRGQNEANFAHHRRDR